MNLSDEQLEQIKKWGGYCLPPQKMAIMLDLPRSVHENFIFEFSDPDSDIRINWEYGKTSGELSVMESMENFSTMQVEGAGEAAKTLGWMKSKQRLNQLKSELFGI